MKLFSSVRFGFSDSCMMYSEKKLLSFSTRFHDSGIIFSILTIRYVLRLLMKNMSSIDKYERCTTCFEAIVHDMDMQSLLNVLLSSSDPHFVAWLKNKQMTPMTSPRHCLDPHSKPLRLWPLNLKKSLLSF